MNQAIAMGNSKQKLTITFKIETTGLPDIDLAVIQEVGMEWVINSTKMKPGVVKMGRIYHKGFVGDPSSHEEIRYTLLQKSESELLITAKLMKPNEDSP